MRTEELNLKKCPKLWPSAVRLAATLSIFVFHFLGLLGQYQYQLDFCAILAFCFISGYLNSGIHQDRASWLKKRYLGIMVPYWIVIVPRLLAAIMLKYETVTWLKVFSALAGANMFLEDPVMVISWYVTFVLLLYLYTFIESLFKGQYTILVMLIGVVIFSVFLHKTYYFIAFVTGLRLAANSKQNTTRSSLYSKISNFLFSIQKYCYPFFLIHGTVLLLFIRKTTISPVCILIISILLTSAFSVVLLLGSQAILSWAANRGLKRMQPHMGEGKAGANQ